MNKYAYIANGDVAYVIESEVTPINGDWRLVVAPTIPYHSPTTQELVQTGWSLTDTTATPTFVVMERPFVGSNSSTVAFTPPITNIVPQTISLWSFRTMLLLRGLIDQVQSLIDNLPEPEKSVANIQWEYGNYIDRNHPLINQLGTQLGLTSEQIDNIFIEADKLK